MAIVACTFDFNNVVFAAFVGDDSVIWGTEMFLHEPTYFCEKTFNVGVKMLQKNFVHFCSKFLIPVGDQWIFYPDPLKLLTKLGRHDARNFEHLEEYRKSILDLVGIYNNTTVHYFVAQAVAERYETSVDITEFLGALTSLIKSKSLFADLFYAPTGVTLRHERNFQSLE